MVNTTTVRDQLMFKAGLQVFLAIAAVAFTMLYTMPKLEAIGLQSEQTNIVVKNYQDIHNNGIPYSQLVSTIRGVGNNEELIEVVSTSPDATKEIIQKTGNSPYLEWITDQLISSDKDRAIMADIRSRINSIIPTLSPVNANIDENSATMRDYISFVEQKILRDFSLQSLSPLGIESVKYIADQEEKKSKESEESPENPVSTHKNPIGEFVVNIGFEATNQNISRAIDFIHSLGNPEIFNESGILPNPPKVMSNPLVTIESLRTEKLISSDSPNSLNKGQLAIKFYIRGSSMSDTDYLKETFRKRHGELSEKIATALKNCEADASCVEIDALKNIQNKFLQFSRSFDDTMANANNNNVETVYLIGSQIISLKSISDEFENIVK